MKRGLFCVVALAVTTLGACDTRPPASEEPILSLRQLNGCWTDFSDPLRQVLCFDRGTGTVAVERGDGLGRVICRGEGRAALEPPRLTVTQRSVANGCEGGRTFDGQRVECDLEMSTVYGMFCNRWIGSANGTQYILTRL